MSPTIRKRIFLHVDMDAFYAAIEQRDNPAYRGKPVIVGSAPDQRGVVSTASYEARRFGVHSAMPSRTAGRLCPQGIFIPPRMSHYTTVSRELRAIFERYTPLIEPLSLDEAFLDVTGSTRLYGSGPEMAKQIQADIQRELQLTGSIGVAPNKFLAKMASDMNKPNGITIVPETPPEIRTFLAPLPIGRLWGVGPTTAKALIRGGIRTIGDLQKASRGLLEHLIGARGAEDLQALANGEDAREIEMGIRAKSISREHTFSRDEAAANVLEDTLIELVDDVAARLRADGRYAGTAKVKLRLKDFTTVVRQAPLSPPTRNGDALLVAARRLFATIARPQTVRLIGFGVSKFTDHPPAPDDLFAGDANIKTKKHENLERTVDEIRKRLGPAAIRRARQLPPPADV